MPVKLWISARPQVACTILFILLLSAVTTWLSFTFPHSIVDDAYISARYAQNLARYGQLTWNTGADPVEGYTGILIPLVYAALFKAGFQFEVVAPITGLVCFWITGYALIRFNQQQPAAAAIVTLFYCLTPFLYRHVFSGMETACFACLLALAVGLAGQDFRPHSLPLFAVSLLLLALVRPEGLLFALTLCAAVLLAMRSKRRSWWLVLLFLFPYCGYFAWRWQYYGHFLPNPYYIKVTGGWAAGAVEQIGAFFLRNSFTPALGVLFGVGLALWLARAKAGFHGAANPKPAALTALTLAPLVFILLVYARSNLSMNFSHRFLAPYYPLLLLVAGAWLQTGFSALSSPPHQKRALTLAAVSLCGVSLALPFPSAYRIVWREANLSRRLIQSEHIPLGRQLQQTIPKNETLVVLKDAGAIPFHAGLPTIDLGGLNDEYLAHTRPATPEVLDYIFRSRPGAVVITSYAPSAPDRSLAGGDQGLVQALLDDRRFEAYTLVQVFPPPVDGMQYYEFVYIRGDLAAGYLDYTQ